MHTCPVDDFTLKPETREGVNIERCTLCGGVWLDAGELETLQNTQDSDFREVPTTPLDSVRAAEDMARAAHEAVRKCVVCDADMAKSEYGFASQVVIDRCPNGHGMWLDKGELSRLEMFFEDQQDFSKILDEIEKEDRGFSAALSRIFGRRS